MHTENTFLKVIHTLAGRWPVRHIPWTITWNTRCTHIKIQNHIVNFDHNGRSYNLRVPGVPAVIIIFRPASASLSSSFLLPLYRCAMISFRRSYLLQSVVIFQSFAGVDRLDRQIGLTEFGVTFCTSICWNVARFFFFCVGRLFFCCFCCFFEDFAGVVHETSEKTMWIWIAIAHRVYLISRISRDRLIVSNNFWSFFFIFIFYF